MKRRKVYAPPRRDHLAPSTSDVAHYQSLHRMVHLHRSISGYLLERMGLVSTARNISSISCWAMDLATSLETLATAFVYTSSVSAQVVIRNYAGWFNPSRFLYFLPTQDLKNGQGGCISAITPSSLPRRMCLFPSVSFHYHIQYRITLCFLIPPLVDNSTK